jgi:hypothetical protein
MPNSPPLKLFIIYARDDQPAMVELKAHLRPLEKRGGLTVWYDEKVLPGEEWDKAIKAQLETADIVLLFISKHFFNSEYIEKEELKKALERHKKGEAVVVPVIVKPCLWEANEEIAALQVLPKNGKPVSSWREADEAWEDVARGIQTLFTEDDVNQDLYGDDSLNGKKPDFEEMAISFIQKRNSKYKETSGKKFARLLINIFLLAIAVFFLSMVFRIIFK